MKQIFKNLAIATTSVLSLFVLSVSPIVAASANSEAACEGLALTGQGCDTSADSGPTVNGTIALALNMLSFIVGIAGVIMVMIGGFKYITSSGDSNNINSAKNTILYALIGIVIAVLSQVIVRFVLRNVAPVGDSTHTTMVVRVNRTS